jgi:hypothetical protein
MKIQTNTSLLKDLANGDKAFEMQMLELIRAELALEIPRMMPLYHEKNHPELYRIAHQLKTSVSYIFEQEIFAILTQIEQEAKQNLATDELFRGIEYLDQHLLDMLEAIDNLAGL